MLNVTKEFLQGLLGPNVQMNLVTSLMKYPLVLIEMYRMFKLQIHDRIYLLIEPRSAEIRYEQLAKHLQEVEKASGWKGVLLLRQLAKSRQRLLFEQRIPVIVPQQVVYLPESLMFWDEATHPAPSLEGSFSLSEQLICLYVFYQPQDWFSGVSLAKHLKVTSMTVSRALRVLFEMDVLEKTGRAPQIRYRRVDRSEYYARTKARLKSPIDDVVYLRSNPIQADRSCISGLSALARQTDLFEDLDERSVAIHRLLREKFVLDTIDAFEVKKGIEPLVRLEVWRYDPRLLSSSDLVDPLSLVACFQSERDEPRIDAACKDLEERACLD
jgi:DNA-binding MarR family transcriptional regulator